MGTFLRSLDDLKHVRLHAVRISTPSNESGIIIVIQYPCVFFHGLCEMVFHSSSYFLSVLRSPTFDILDQAMHLGGGDKNAWGHVGMMLQSLSLLAVQYGLGTAMLEAWGNLGNCATCHGLAGDVDCIKQRFEHVRAIKCEL